MALDPITAIASAIAECSKALGLWLASAEKRKLENAKDAGEKYIFVNEKAGEFKNIIDKKQKELLLHYRRKFFQYN